MTVKIIVYKADNPAPQECRNKYEVWVEQLRKAALKSSMKSFSFRRSSWEKEFQLLEKQLGENQSLLVPTLDWYCRNIGRPYVPICWSAKAFRMKFDSIRAAMSRMVDLVTVDKAKVDKLIKSITHLGWKATDLEKAVTQSIYYWEQFKDKVRQNQNKIESGFYEVVRTIFFEESFLCNWFYKVHVKKAFQINSLFRIDEVFNPQSQLVDEYGVRAAQKWYGANAAKYWKELRAKINW